MMSNKTMKRAILNSINFAVKHNIRDNGLQDRGRPILDSLVRECIQNSLDAADSYDSNFVKVEFDIKSFDIPNLTQHLEGLECLNTRKNIPNRYLAIRDCYTWGLTGDYFDEDSNLKKLVASFGNPQQESGSGGSCGAGKTIYYRLGIGLVIFYSRVKVEGGFESLMIAVLVQDPESTDAIFPNVNRSNPHGIVMWGEPIVSYPGEVQETRDQETIKKILEGLDYRPFMDNETGTAIIIPFVDENNLLASNRSEDDVNVPYWRNNIEDYLKISVQRWYSARLNNLAYRKVFVLAKDKALKVYINGKLISSDDERMFCKLLRTLYNKASLANAISCDTSEEYDSFNDFPIGLKEIRVNKTIVDNVVGHISYISIPKTELDVDSQSFYSYIDLDLEEGTPVVTYCRKPGMNVSYEYQAPWITGVKTSNDEYLICYFVLKSRAKVAVAENLTIEDYMRAGEQATHDSWFDREIDSRYNPTKKSPKLAASIQTNVRNKIKEIIKPDEFSSIEKKKVEGLGNLFGKVFLKNIMNSKGGRPTDISRKKSNPKSGAHVKTVKRLSKDINTSFSSNGNVIIDISLSTGKSRKSKGCSVELNVLSSGGRMSIEKWYKDVGAAFPFKLIESGITITSLDGSRTSASDLVIFKELYSEKKERYGAQIEFADHESHTYECNVRFTISVATKESKPYINIIENKEDKNE